MCLFANYKKNNKKIKAINQNTAYSRIFIYTSALLAIAIDAHVGQPAICRLTTPTQFAINFL